MAEGWSAKAATRGQASLESRGISLPGRIRRSRGIFGRGPSLGEDPAARVVPGVSTTAIGVMGQADAAGVYGLSRTTGVIGDGSTGQIGVEGFGSQYGVYGHVDWKRPNPDGSGVFGAADVSDPDNPVGHAARF